MDSLLFADIFSFKSGSRKLGIVKEQGSMGKEIQIPTVQLDFATPKRFNLVYTNKEGKEEFVVMVHRAILGSYERFLALLIEHYAGAFPIWLSPAQIYLTPVGKTHHPAVKKIAQELKESGLRTEIDLSNETISYKIRKAEVQKIPYIVVIGDKEIKGKYLNIRARGNKMEKLTKKQFIEKVLKQIRNKKS